MAEGEGNVITLLNSKGDADMAEGEGNVITLLNLNLV